MQIQKQQIQSNLQTIFSFDLTKLYKTSDTKQSWNGYSDSDLEKYIKNILSILKKISKDDSVLDYIGVSNLNILVTYLQNFISSFQSNSGIFNISIDQITTHHHEPLNWIENINSVLRSSGIYTEVEVSANQIKETNQSFLEVQPFLDEVISKKPAYEQALEELTGLLDKQGEVNTATLHGQADAFKKRAEEYENDKNSIPIGSFIVSFWLLGAFIFAIITFSTTVFVIKSGGLNISSGGALLRITSIIVPSYLTVFCASQYLYGKKMYESYMFKYASLQTMNNLIQTNNDLKEKILSRGLDVLFSEPHTKISEGSKEDKIIISELLSMLKGQLK